ncbi:hypothetical protein Sste5346_006314 [Sporothrix stenoceras]|uniref:Zn(2)-C6 fungal-type domain-containing protein n=1 Tax=Sporothrix stenoceras TaxID=5173 RepID=A0ABR3YZY6_9PEZI
MDHPRAPRRKVKTGCATCRTRKVKCDEGRPACQKCVVTGLTCDGYASPFRVWVSEPRQGVAKTPISAVPEPVVTSSDGTSSEITPADIAQLQRCFSSKTLFPTVTLDCDDEARQILQASQTDPAVRHAVSSLRALRADLEAAASPSEGQMSLTHLSHAAASYAAATGTTPSRDYGLQQYCIALSGLASSLSTIGVALPGTPPPTIRSALLCCQVFISIEQVRGNFAAMALHIAQGLRILSEYRSHDKGLPALDVFVIKLIAAPCKFAGMQRGVPSSAGSTPTDTDGSGSGANYRLRPLAPDLGSELNRLAMLTVSFLASMDAGAPETSLISTINFLLRSITTWHASLEREQQTTPRPEFMSIVFLRFFHQVLRVVLLSVLHSLSSTDDTTDKSCPSKVMDSEYRKLQSISSTVSERVHADGLKNGK